MQIVPAVEYKSTMERSRARLDYYIEKAVGATDEQSWEENAERSIEQAIKEWETENLAEKETDPEGYEKKQKELRTYLELEKESKYVEWLTGRFAEKAGKEVLKELKAELKAAIRGYSVEGYGADEAEKLQKDIKLKTEEIIERYIEEYESRYGIKNLELAARIKEKGIREEAVRDGKECLEKEEVITEARMLARAEGSRLVARFQSDTKSLRAEKSEKAAGVIAGRIAEKAAKESNEKIDELLTKIETNLETGEKEGYSNEGLLMQFQEVFNRGLSAWEEAELEFLTNRAEWEKEAEEAYNTSEKVWTEAYSELQKKRTEWAESIQEKIKDLKNKIEAENYEQEKKVEDLLEKYRALINEEVERKLQAAHSQKTIYNNLRSGLGTVTEGLNAFEKIFEIDGGNEKYDGLYSYWKTEAEGHVEKVDETLINEVKKRIKENHLEDTKTEAFVSWLEQAEQYNKRIKETIETIKNLTADTNVSEGKYSELELEIYKAKSVEKYWAEELEIAEAVEEYAETKDSTRESREETEKRLKESEESYKEAWKAYDEAIEKLNEYSKKIEEVGAKLQGAYRELAEKKETVEQLKAEYQLLYAQSQGLDEYAVVKQIYTNIKYYEETEKNLKAAEEKYEKYSLIKTIEEEKKKIEKNAEDSLSVYERTEAIIDGIIEKIKGGSIEEYESYLDGIDWKGTYETENGLYGTGEYLKEKYKEEMNEIRSYLNEIKTAEISEKTERFKEYVKRIYSAKALRAAEYIKKCEAYKKAGLEDSEPEVNETEKYLEKAEKELEADTELTYEEKSSIENLIKNLNEAEKYELKEEKKASLKEEGARYNKAKVRENNQKETKALLDYINTNEVTKNYKDKKYDSVIEYCAEISRLAEKCGRAAAKTAAEYIDSYLRQEAFKYQAESGNDQEYYKKELNKLAEEIEEKIQNNQENDYEKLIVEYNFLSYAYEEAEADKWITILEEEKYSENKKLEEKEAEYIKEFLSKNKNNEKEKTLEEITKAKKKFLTDIAECKALSEDGLNEESETNYNALKEAADSYLSKLMLCANEYRLLKEEVNTSQLEAKSREIKEAEEAAFQKTEYYQSVLEAFHKASEEYEKKVEETNEIYRKTEESRLEKRKAQAVYDWAESIYLKSIGENTDENYVTPKEQASEAEYAYKRAKQSREILEATAESRKKEKAKASEEEKAYKEADRNYYLASVLNSRLEEK
ncbi:MAG: hypothetical protein UHO11_03310, partial [Treponema sp.]|nr:hypothetical protein [Treponema sp.]